MSDHLARFFGLSKTPSPEPPPPSPPPSVNLSDPDADAAEAMAEVVEALQTRDLWEDQPDEVLESWGFYSTSTTPNERHDHAFHIIDGAARACKRREEWARHPAVRDALHAAGRAWDIAHRRRHQGAGQ